MKNKTFTLLEVLIVFVIIGILLTIAIPNIFKARDKARAIQDLIEQGIPAENITDTMLNKYFEEKQEKKKKDKIEQKITPSHFVSDSNEW